MRSQAWQTLDMLLRRIPANSLDYTQTYSDIVAQRLMFQILGSVPGKMYLDGLKDGINCRMDNGELPKSALSRFF